MVVPRVCGCVCGGVLGWKKDRIRNNEAGSGNNEAGSGNNARVQEQKEDGFRNKKKDRFRNNERTGSGTKILPVESCAQAYGLSTLSSKNMHGHGGREG